MERKEVVAVNELKMLGKMFVEVGDVFEVCYMNGYEVKVKKDNMTLLLDKDTFDKTFEFYKENLDSEKYNNVDNEDGYKVDPGIIYSTTEHISYKVDEEIIREMLEDAEYEVSTVFDKCAVVHCKLPNGFVITETSACVDPDNYDEEIGIDICMQKIEDKLWELESYRLQCALYDNEVIEQCMHCEDFEDCDTKPFDVLYVRN